MTDTTDHTQMTQDRMTPTQLAQRNADLVRERDAGKTFAELGEQFGITKQHAHKAYWQTLAAVPQLAVTEMRAQQNARLEMVLTRLEDIADRKFVMVSGGEIVHGPDGEPLRDSGPEVQALRELRATLETQAKLNGTCAPAQVTVNGQINYVIEGINLEALK